MKVSVCCHMQTGLNSVCCVQHCITLYKCNLELYCAVWFAGRLSDSLVLWPMRFVPGRT